MDHAQLFAGLQAAARKPSLNREVLFWRLLGAPGSYNAVLTRLLVVPMAPIALTGFNSSYLSVALQAPKLEPSQSRPKPSRVHSRNVLNSKDINSMCTGKEWPCAHSSAHESLEILCPP